MILEEIIHHLARARAVLARHVGLVGNIAAFTLKREASA